MKATANCPGCGRFARSHYFTEYNGWFNILYQTTFCAQCGQITEGLT